MKCWVAEEEEEEVGESLLHVVILCSSVLAIYEIFSSSLKNNQLDYFQEIFRSLFPLRDLL